MGMIFLHNLSIDEVIFVNKTLQNGFSFLLSNSKFFTSKGPVILNLVFSITLIFQKLEILPPVRLF